jgi:hypothetical protein
MVKTEYQRKGLARALLAPVLDKACFYISTSIKRLMNLIEVFRRDRQREMVTRLLCPQQMMITYVVFFPCHNQVSKFCDPLGPRLFPAWVYAKRVQDHTLAVG